jgi:serine/threonine protein kinase
MARCPTCGLDYPANERFCAEDGTPLPVTDTGAPVAVVPEWGEHTIAAPSSLLENLNEAPRFEDAPATLNQGSLDALLAQGNTFPEEDEAERPSHPSSAEAWPKPEPQDPAMQTLPDEESPSPLAPSVSAPHASEAQASQETASIEPPPEAEDRSGQMVGTYRLTKKLAEGGMGVVYEATHPILERTIAVKLIHPAFIKDPLAAWRFLDEAKALSRSRHPNIVEVFDLGQLEDETFFLQMELLRGESLRDRLMRGPLGFEEARRVFLAVASGLGAAHEKGIIHRDLKPENVFLCEDGAIKLLDFGVVKLSRQELSFTRTQPGILVGTPEYMSPDQILGEQELDPRADIYSFGLVLFEALTGQLAFTGDTLLALLTKHVNDPPPRPSEVLGKAIPAYLENLCLRCLAKARDDRYASVREMIEALSQPESSPPSGQHLSRGVQALVERAVSGELTPGDLRRGAPLAQELSVLGRRWRRVDGLNFGDAASEAEHEVIHNGALRRVRLEGAFPNGRNLSDDGIQHNHTLQFQLFHITPGQDALLLLRVDVGSEHPWEAEIFCEGEPITRNPLTADAVYRWRHETILLPGARLTRDRVQLARRPPSGQPLSLYAAWLYQPITRPESHAT